MNKKITTPESIELRSESVQEILGRPPRWIIRWGISIIFIVVAILVVGSYFFKYPDVLTASITVTTENLPAGITAKTSGRIDTLFVSEKQHVKQGDLLAVIESAARWRDVLELKAALGRHSRESGNPVHEGIAGQARNDTGQARNDDSLSPFSILLSPNLRLGDIQSAYNSYLKSYEDYQFFITTDYHHKKIAVIKKQIKI
jgi:HlyD family secretion protein